MPLKFLGQPFALQLQFTIDIFFSTAVLRKFFNIGFSYKHCNFLHICLLVKMASKTVTRFINLHVNLSLLILSFGVCGSLVSSYASCKFVIWLEDVSAFTSDVRGFVFLVCVCCVLWPESRHRDTFHYWVAQEGKAQSRNEKHNLSMSKKRQNGGRISQRVCISHSLFNKADFLGKRA